MLDEISWEQFQEWLAYEVIEPFGDRRADWHFASLCAVTANVAAARGGSRTRFKVADFLLEFSSEEKPLPTVEAPRQAWQQQKMIAKMFVAIANADEERKKARADRDAQRKARAAKRQTPQVERRPRRPSAESVERVRAALTKRT